MAKFDLKRETASGKIGQGGSPGGSGTTASGSPKAGGAASAAAPAPFEVRRGFLVRFMAVLIGGLVALFPFAAGLLVFADPWRRPAAAARLVKVATLDDVPDDGIPRRFCVSENCIDAWNSYPNQPVGAVYLRRTKGRAVPEALQATCPHAGCMVDYASSAHVFQCPCHNSSFQPDGQIIQPSPAPRPMDTLVCKVIDHSGVKEVWVEFQNFYTGSAEKIAKI